MPPVKSLGNSRAQYNYKFGLTGLEAALPPPGPVYSDDVFSTYLTEGATDESMDIDNSINFATHGGLIWLKRRNGTASTYTQHVLIDSERGADSTLLLPSTSGISTVASGSSFDSDGFTWATENNFHPTGADYVSWSFRKQPGFFDIQTTTVATTSEDIVFNHNLGTTPGCVIVKRISNSSPWYVYHRSLGNPSNDVLELNSDTDAVTTAQSSWKTVDDSQVVVDNPMLFGQTGTFIAYLFAHDDQRFGTNQDESIIKCGTYLADGQADGPTIDLGWEPQWLLVKNSSYVSFNESWDMIDTMRGWDRSHADGYYKWVSANENDVENSNAAYRINSQGFQVAGNGAGNISGQNYIYIAIRRPHKPITDPTKLFAIDSATSTLPAFTSNFAVDATLHRVVDIDNNNWMASRLTGTQILKTNLSDNEISSTSRTWDYNDGCFESLGANPDYYGWMFRRAPGFFDVVAYTGDSTNGTLNHSLGVIPELIITKSRNRTTYSDWSVVYLKNSSTMEQSYGYFDDNHFTDSSGATTLLSSASSTQITRGSSYVANNTGDTYITYLFASLPGVSKVGTFQGNSSNKDIDCGFSNGARFVMIKRIAGGGTSGNHWTVWDKTRGIVEGNDPYFLLNDDAAEVTDTDYIDHLDAGFRLTSTAPAHINGLGNDFIFLAIA